MNLLLLNVWRPIFSFCIRKKYENVILSKNLRSLLVIWLIHLLHSLAICIIFLSSSCLKVIGFRHHSRLLKPEASVYVFYLVPHWARIDRDSCRVFSLMLLT